MVLFITRKFPPTKGGMERAAFELSKHLSQITQVKLIKWGGSNKWLPFVLPCLLFSCLWSLLTKKIHVIYLQDGLLAPLGLIFKLFTRKPVVITVHGRDITYDNPLYQCIIPRCLRWLNRVVCVSEATKQQCISRKIAQDKLIIIPNGISDEYYLNKERQLIKKVLSSEIEVQLEDKALILSAGRLVERKGIHWFVENVMPILINYHSKCRYIIAGEGNFSDQVRETIERIGINKHVFALGNVTEELLRSLYNGCDIFTMPNIPVKGDMEGFGLVALEAASCGLPVVASDLEGIKDAIQDGKNGFLVEPGNAQAFFDKMDELLRNDEIRRSFGERARQYTLDNYGWDKMAQRYVDVFYKLNNNSQVQ